ncbi:hypothetical protein [Gilvibacter sp.]|uniref:hypothetical protein n=1 Tax=Gilvibacter sp. TaxID=2729997 RepID=UPI003F49FE24
MEGFIAFGNDPEWGMLLEKAKIAKRFYGFFVSLAHWNQVSVRLEKCNKPKDYSPAARDPGFSLLQKKDLQSLSK